MAADAAFFWLLLSALATLPALRASWRSLRRAEIACLGSLVALAWWLRAWVVAPSILRGHYNGYEHLAATLRVVEGHDLPMEAFLPGHGVLLSWVNVVCRLDLDRWFAVDIALGVLAVPVAFLAIWRWTGDATDALVGGALVAVDPAHVRFSASEDPMPLIALCAWFMLLGTALHGRDRQPSGAWLAAGALGFAIATKAEGLLLGVGFGALWWSAHSGAGPVLSPRARYAIGAGLALLVASLALPLLRSRGYMANPQYGGMRLASYAQHVAELPLGMLLHNPLGDPRYAAPAVTALVLVGLVTGCARRDRVVLACLAFLAVLFVRIYEDFPLPFDERVTREAPRWFFRHWFHSRMGAGVKGDVRWNLHAMVPWTLLAVAGARWIRERVRAPWVLAALVIAGGATFVTTRGWWRHRWADQREADLLTRAARALPIPCAIVLPRDVPAQGPVVRHAQPLKLLDVVDPRWRDTPRVLQDEGDVPPELRRCAVYYRGLSCYVWEPDVPLDPQRTEHDGCSARFSDPGMAPIDGLVERFAYEDYSNFEVIARAVTLGFYRVRTP